VRVCGLGGEREGEGEGGGLQLALARDGGLSWWQQGRWEGVTALVALTARQSNLDDDDEEGEVEDFIGEVPLDML
jgi:hypothetical protein